MLQDWALKRNSVVKYFFLQLFKLLVGQRGVWHATDEQERLDIYKKFGASQSVNIALNIPRTVPPLTDIVYPGHDQRINLVFLSLINSNKNLHLIIRAVKKVAESFTLSIYGPIIDQDYWKKCLSEFDIEAKNENIRYEGAVPAWDVPAILGCYHFFILPTRGENFGHAIFDSLTVGTPVIISRFTPWKDIEQSSAGYYIDIDSEDSLCERLSLIKTLNADEYFNLRTKAVGYASRYWEQSNYKKDYSFLFE